MTDDELLLHTIAEEEAPPPTAPKEQGSWEPLMNEGGQREVFYEETSKIIVAVGPKGSGKTDGCLNRIVRHCYENRNALALVIATTQRVASEGAGYDLVDRILPMWRDGNRASLRIRDKDGQLVSNPIAGQLIDNGIGLDFTQWKLDPVTKDRHLWIANRFGGWSKVLLVSIQRATEVQKKMFSIQPSLIYIEELMNCDGEEYFSATFAQLGRRRGIDGPQIWMASMNTESPDHWTYKKLYGESVVTTGGRAWPKDPEKPGVMRDPDWAVYYIWFPENEHNLPPGYVERLNTAYKSDPILSQRMLEAKWLSYPAGAALFRHHYAPDRHLFGDSKKNTGLLPLVDWPIIVGYDPGQANTGISFMQCIPMSAESYLWTIFDELCYHGEHIPYPRLTRWLMEKMRYWCQRMDTRFIYRHISGDDATNVFQPNKGATTARDIMDYSAQIIRNDKERFAMLEPIRIIGCPKPAGSKEQRVALTMDILDEDLLAVSAACPWHINMFNQQLAAKDAPMEAARSKWQHTFDGLSYPVYYRQYILKGPFSGHRREEDAVSVTIG